MKNNLLIPIIFIMCFLSISLSSEAGTNGIYGLEGSGYIINVEFGKNTLTVIEPNKQSVYDQIDSNLYEFTNVNNRNIRYWLRVIDDSTIEASKPDNDSDPTVLKLLQKTSSKSDNEQSKNQIDHSIEQLNKVQH